MDVITLRQVLENDIVGKLLETERIVHSYSGDIYSELPWEEKNIVYSLPKKNEYSLILMSNDEVVGFSIAYEFILQWAHISRVAIHPSYQGKNLGYMLLKSQTHNIFFDNNDIITIEITKDNKAALQLYRKIGFQIMQIDLLYFYCKIRKKAVDNYIGDNYNQEVLYITRDNKDIKHFLERLV